MIAIDTYDKRMIWYPFNKERIHQFNVSFMTHPSLNKHGNHSDQVIKLFQWAFKSVTVKCIKNELYKKNVSVLSLMMFYENRNTLMYKVIRVVIYNCIDEHICLGYLVLLQETLPKQNYNSKKTKFNYFSVLGIPDILKNIMSGHGLVKY